MLVDYLFSLLPMVIVCTVLIISGHWKIPVVFAISVKFEGVRFGAVDDLKARLTAAALKAARNTIL